MHWWHALLGLHGVLVGRFLHACWRWRKRTARLYLDRQRLKIGCGDREYEIFDPPPWRLDRWGWWVARKTIHRGEVTITTAAEARPYRVFEIRK